ncbi:hypothetical protein A1O3_09238, partial [Capronia epimyces CBS 606.96]
KDSFDEADDIGTSCAVVRVHAEPDSTTLVQWEGSVYSQGPLTPGAANDIQ